MQQRASLVFANPPAHGRFAAACALVDRVQFEQLSTTKSGSVLGKAINVMDHEQAAIVSALHERAVQVQAMQQESRAYYEMSLLVRAVEALGYWRQVEHEYASRVPRPGSVPTKVKKAFEETKEAMEPLLAGLLLEAKNGAAQASHSL